MSPERSQKLPLKITLVAGLTATALFGVTADIESNRSSADDRQASACIAEGDSSCMNDQLDASNADKLFRIDGALALAMLASASSAGTQLYRRRET
jgi:hypothetical protein